MVLYNLYKLYNLYNLYIIVNVYKWLKLLFDCRINSLIRLYEVSREIYWLSLHETDSYRFDVRVFLRSSLQFCANSTEKSYRIIESDDGVNYNERNSNKNVS